MCPLEPLERRHALPRCGFSRRPDLNEFSEGYLERRPRREDGCPLDQLAGRELDSVRARRATMRGPGVIRPQSERNLLSGLTNSPLSEIALANGFADQSGARASAAVPETTGPEARSTSGLARACSQGSRVRAWMRGGRRLKRAAFRPRSASRRAGFRLATERGQGPVGREPQRRFVEQLKRAGKSTSLARNALSLLRRVCSLAVAAGRLTKKPCLGLHGL